MVVLAAQIAILMQVRVVYGIEHDDCSFEPQGEVGRGNRTLQLRDVREESDGPGVLVYELLDESEAGQRSIYIYKDSFLSSARYSSDRFGLFCSHFTGQYHYDESAEEYRRHVQAEVVLLGGHIAIYFGDQCGAYYVETDAEQMPFATVLQKVSVQENVIDIAQQLRMPPYTSLSQDPHALIDDFSCWPLSSNL
jgi:hypothetical protein